MRVELIPNQLYVNVLSHTIPNTQGTFWTLVSDGYQAHNQQEIAFTLRQPDTPPALPPRQLFSYFSSVYDFAKRGQLVRAGDFSEFGPAGLIFPEWRGLTYADAHPTNEAPLPPGTLSAITVNADELAVIKAAGGHRILARLGRMYGYFPFPFWNEPGRRSVAQRGEQSLLYQLPHMSIPGLFGVLSEETLTLEVLQSKAPEILAAVESAPEGAGFALLLGPSPRANGWLVWEPGQQSPSAITPPGGGARLSGFSLIFALGLDQDTSSLFEDGFSMMLRKETWHKWKKALQEQRNLVLPTSNLQVELRFIREDYQNPVDGAVYHSPGGWETHQPEGAPPATNEARIVLLSSQQEISESIDIGTLSQFMKSVIALLESPSLVWGQPREVYLQFELAPPKGASVQFASQPKGPLPQELLQKLESLPSPSVRKKISFQVIKKVGGYAS